MKKVVAVLLLICAFDKTQAHNSTSPGVFTVVCPEGLIKSKQLNCILTTHDLEGPLGLNITVGGQSRNLNTAFSISKILSISANTAITLNFPTEHFPDGNYKLSVTGLDGFEFYGENSLTYVFKLFSIFVQTDKALYTSDDLVRFRLFAVDPNTLPYAIKGTTDVTILNPSNVVVTKFSGVAFTKGKYESDFQLSSAPMNGIWTIKIEAESQVFSKTFEVEKYTLPAFAATLLVPENVPFADGKFPVTVGALYTFGRSAQGSAVVSFKLNGYQLVFKRTIAIDGSSMTFEVDLNADLQITEVFYNQFVTIEVDFTDSLTGQIATTSDQVNILRFMYQISIDAASSFTAGLHYAFAVTVKRFDGTPAPLGSSGQVTSILDNGPPVVQAFIVDDMSSAQVDLVIPVNTSVLHILVSYEDASLDSYVYSGNSHQEYSLSVEIVTAYPFIYEPVEVNFIATEDISTSVIVAMVSKGVIVQALKLPLDNSRGSTTIVPKFSFAPETTIFAYYVRSDGEIVSGSAKLTLKSRLPSFLTLAITNTTVKPGEDAYLEIISPMHSTVSLLAIDQRSLLLKSGNDLSLDDIFNDLNQYNTKSGFVWMNPMRAFFFPWFFYQTYEMKFSSSGLAIVSNAINRLPLNPPIGDPQIQELNGNPGPPLFDTPTPSKRPRVRKNFAETFLWETVEVLKKNTRIPGRGITSITAKVPDSITSYLISGVSMNNRHGLALGQAKPLLTVFQPFFIQMTLPFSIKRGEILRQEILVFNYLSESQSVTVTLEKNKLEYNLHDSDKDGWESDNGTYFQSFNVNSGSPQKLIVHLEAIVLGFVTLKVTAIGSLAGDAVEQKLRVTPEGIPRYIVSTTIVQHNESEAVSAELSCLIPDNVVADTISISTTVVGNVLGNSLSNLASLIQMPGGCGEQNMLNFVPNIVILKYLEATNQLTDAVRIQAIAFTEQGYQQELSYLRTDGSFSAFGNSDPVGSTWLTAFVIGSFVSAESYITIDQSVLNGGLEFIISKQNENGSFHEDGQVIHKDMQGGSAEGVALTAYISIVLTQSLSKFPLSQSARDLALANVVTNYNDTDVYSLAVVSYALEIAENEFSEIAFNKFLSLAIETSDELHWEKNIVGDPSFYVANSLDVEITAYGLLSALKRGDISLALKIVRWLVKQQNPTGGFQSTQDTVVTLSSLAAFAASFGSSSSNLSLTITPQFGFDIITSVNGNNSLVLQNFDLADNVRKLGIFSSQYGNGVAIVAMSCSFYVNDSLQLPRFNIQQEFVDSCYGYLKLKVCVSSVITDDGWTPGMVLVTTKLPSGYIYDNKSPVCTAINKLDIANGGTEVQAYMNNVTEDLTCCFINAIRVSELENLKGGSIEVVDYYDTSKTASLLYSVPPLSEC